MIWRLLYNLLALPVLSAGLLIAALGMEKVRRAVKGRLGEGDRLRGARSRCQDGAHRVLMHCASAGELESAIPLIQALHEQLTVSIVLSYYSPSAVDRARTVADIADHIYLPFDSPRRINRLLDTLDPDLIIVVKHDLWPNLVWQAKRRSVPVLLVNAYARPNAALIHQRLLIPFAREMHRALSEVHAVSGEDARRLRFLTGTVATVFRTGDTRFDRVRDRAITSHDDQGRLRQAASGRRVFVAGSTWPADESLLVNAWREARQQHDDALLVLVPHELGEDHLAAIDDQFGEFGCVRLTAWEATRVDELPSVLIVDKMGILAGLYGLGDGAYVGGGHGAGVHSVIEPAVFGIPVSFGPNNGMSHEARELLLSGAATLIEDQATMTEFVADVLSLGHHAREQGRKAGEYVRGKAGVSRTLATHIATHWLATPGSIPDNSAVSSPAGIPHRG